MRRAVISKLTPGLQGLWAFRRLRLFYLKMLGNGIRVYTMGLAPVSRFIGSQDYDTGAASLPIANRMGIASHRATAPGQEKAPVPCLVKRFLYMAEVIGSKFLGESSDFGGRFGVVRFTIDHCFQMSLREFYYPTFPS